MIYRAIIISMIEVGPYNPDNPHEYCQVQDIMTEAGVFYDIRDSKANLDSLVANNPNSVIVARDGNEVVGSIMSSPLGVNIALIWGLAVAESRRRQGIGTELTTTMIRTLKDTGAKELWAFINVNNDASQAFFEKVGFEFNRENRYFGPWMLLE